MSTEYERAEIDTHQSRGRLRRAWDTLQDTITQPVETVTRRATLRATRGDVERVDPPEDIHEYVELYKEVGLIRKNINEFVDDVTAPGVQVESPDETTQDYFMGGDNAPESAPANGFLSECFVFDEARQPFNKGLKKSVRERWVRGTVLVEYLKADPDDSESIIAGFKFIRPETVAARTYQNTNQLINPDLDSEANRGMDIPEEEITKRDEAAAFIQFDQDSILARHRKGIFDGKTSIPLSQNDVLKMVLDQDIGGEDSRDGVFGESIIKPIAPDATEYRSIKRDLSEAIKGKAWGLWTAQFKPEVLEAGDHVEIIEWNDEDIQATENEIDNMGPGSKLTSDAQIDLQRHEGEVPDIEWALRHYVRDIVDPLPAPFYKHSFADEINQFVTDEQQEDYQSLIRSEREYQRKQWEQALREVARRHPDLTETDLKVRIEPEEDESPVMSLDDSTVDRMKTYAETVDIIENSVSLSREEKRELILQLPGTPEQGTLEEAPLDEDDEQVIEQFAQ